jgi:peptidoglycan/LPS O-acetylase OafA/YrhL
MSRPVAPVTRDADLRRLTMSASVKRATVLSAEGCATPLASVGATTDVDAGSPTVSGSVPALDGLRGVAIIFVMAFHIWRSPATGLGWSGVDLFFVLSGYLITGILWDSRSAPGAVRTFYVRRALRILPLYYGVLAVVFIVRPALGWNHRLDDMALAGEQFWYWTYLSDWRIALDHPHAVTFLTHFWSLSIEEQFYLVWPAIVWRCSRRGALGVAIALSVLALGLRIYIVAATQAAGSVYGLLPCRVDALAAGAIIALALRGPGGASAVRRWVQPAAIVGLVTTVVLVLLRPTVRFVDPGMATIGYTALDWLFAGLVFTAATTGSRLLEWPVLRAAGRYSYGLYVFHPLVMWWIVRDVPWLERSELRFAVGAVIGSVVVAWLSYHLYEQPFLRLKNRWAPMRPPVAATDPMRAAA